MSASDDRIQVIYIDGELEATVTVDVDGWSVAEARLQELWMATVRRRLDEIECRDRWGDWS